MEHKPTSSNYDTFLNYRAAIIRAIGRAWSDEKFEQALYKEPKGALREAFNYDFPYDMHLKILQGSAKWDPLGAVGWVVSMQNTVELVLPPKPEAGQEAVALAEYNAKHLTFLTAY